MTNPFFETQKDRGGGCWYLAIEHQYTRDIVVIDHDDHGTEIGWSCIPQLPDRRDGWKIFDSSPDDKSGWRCISLAWDGGVA